MANSGVGKKMRAVLTFSLIFILLIDAGFAFENSVSNAPKVANGKEDALWQQGKEFSELTKINRRNVLNLKYAQQQNANSVKSSSSLAELYLGRLAEKGKADRRIVGILSLVSGTLYLSTGIWLLIDNKSGGDLLVASGLAIDGLGIWYLKTPSRAERELDNALRIEDVAEREKAGREALFSLADKAQRGRILSAILSGAFSIYCFVAKPYSSRDSEDTEG